MRQIICALIGAVVCPITIFMPVTPTLGQRGSPRILGAATALIIGNGETLALRLSRKMLQIMWALFGAVFGAVLGLVLPASVTPALDLGAIRHELVDFFHDPDGSVTPTLDFLMLPVFGAAWPVFGNCTAVAFWLGSVSRFDV